MDMLAEYLNKLDLSKKIKINSNYPISLQWSNDSVLTKRIKSHLKENLEKNQLTQLTNDLDKLKSVPLWLKLDDSVLKLTAHDIYHTLCMHFRSGEFEDQLFNAQNISFVSPAGPFKDLSIIDCIHEETLEAFVTAYVLQNNLPQRSFRLDTEGEALLNYGEFNERSLRVSVDQLTDTGILFSSDNYELLEVIDDAQYFKFQMTTKNLETYFDLDSELHSDLFFSNNITEAFTVNSTKLSKSLKYDSADTGKFYLFCRYSDIQGTEHADKFKGFIESFKHTVRAVA
jgi:hypothetical protein